MYIYNKELNQVDYYGKYPEFKSYTVSGAHSWSDRQELVEGKDFEWGRNTSYEIVVIPLFVIKQESEDNAWCDIRDIFIKRQDALQYLPQHFSIKRKTQ